MSRPLLALSASVLALTLATGLGHSSSGAEPPGGNAEGRCIYGSYFNITQSRNITCYSKSLQRSTYNHRVREPSSPTIENQMDMIHCEAPSDSFLNLNLYYHAVGVGIEQLISLGLCLFKPSVNCSRVILYLNLTHYDEHNGTVIPVCGINRTDHNLECFCIRYLLHLEKTVTCDHGHNGHSTTIAENTTTDHTESTTEPKDVNLYTQPFRNIPGAGVSVAAFAGSVSLLLLVILVLIVLLSLAIVIKRKKLMNRSSREVSPTPVRFTPSRQNANTGRQSQDSTDGGGGNRTESDGCYSEEETATLLHQD